MRKCWKIPRRTFALHALSIRLALSFLRLVDRLLRWCHSIQWPFPLGFVFLQFTAKCITKPVPTRAAIVNEVGLKAQYTSIQLYYSNKLVVCCLLTPNGWGNFPAQLSICTGQLRRSFICAPKDYSTAFTLLILLPLTLIFISLSHRSIQS